MNEIVKKELCCGCGVCVNVCPVNCIEMYVDKEGFYYPHINEEKCIGCGLCKKRCPNTNIDKLNDLPETFAFINSDDEIRKRSSSGGMFWCLAENVIRSGGVVYGASYSDDYRNVEHVMVDKITDLILLQGSKYIQSCINNLYLEVKEKLDDKKLVLFTGTPCQIAGLHSFLGKKYDNLISVDFICHGVPSNMVWEKYLQYRERVAGAKCVNLNFRKKTKGWKKYSLEMKFENGKTYEKVAAKDKYMQTYLKDICLRESCYQCKHRGFERKSDFTLADFWGIQRICPEMNDGLGTSLVFIHSLKGKELFGKIACNHIILQVDREKAVQSNPSMIKSPERNEKRDLFISTVEEKGICKAHRKFVKRSVFRRLFYKIKMLQNDI